MTISFIGGGNQSTRSHWQPLSHSGVSVILVEQELIIYLISPPVVSWVHVVRSWVFFELRFWLPLWYLQLFSVAQSLVFCVLFYEPLIYILSFVGDFDDCFMDHWFIFCPLYAILTIVSYFLLRLTVSDNSLDLYTFLMYNNNQKN